MKEIELYRKGVLALIFLSQMPHRSAVFSKGKMGYQARQLKGGGVWTQLSHIFPVTRRNKVPNTAVADPWMEVLTGGFAHPRQPHCHVVFPPIEVAGG